GIDVLLTWERQRPPGRMGMFRLHHHHEVAMPTITQAVAQLKANLPDLLPEALLLRIASDIGIRYRQRCLTPAVTSALFLQQVLPRHRARGRPPPPPKVGVPRVRLLQAPPAPDVRLLPPLQPGRPGPLPRRRRPAPRRPLARPSRLRRGRLQLLHARQPG